MKEYIHTLVSSEGIFGDGEDVLFVFELNHHNENRSFGIRRNVIPTHPGLTFLVTLLRGDFYPIVARLNQRLGSLYNGFRTNIVRRTHSFLGAAQFNVCPAFAFRLVIHI